ncbi:hypothetical protein JCM19231_4540 [Vibrio ishigakensis]|nr:hypothetical protein JCM19231_4540 [Vibrio ishigakensis]
MGGPNALITVSESVAGLAKVLENVTEKDSGGFYNYDGQPLPW